MSPEAKPIFIVGLPNMGNHNEIRQELEDKMPGYHIIVFMQRADEPTFQVFYEKDYNEATVDEIKAYIKEGCGLK